MSTEKSSSNIDNQIKISYCLSEKGRIDAFTKHQNALYNQKFFITLHELPQEFHKDLCVTKEGMAYIQCYTFNHFANIDQQHDIEFDSLPKNATECLQMWKVKKDSLANERAIEEYKKKSFWQRLFTKPCVVS